MQLQTRAADIHHLRRSMLVLNDIKTSTGYACTPQKNAQHAEHVSVVTIYIPQSYQASFTVNGHRFSVVNQQPTQRFGFRALISNSITTDDQSAT